jgi:ubiquinone/menaquinone biosynthesis C-methylase UbiE
MSQPKGYVDPEYLQVAAQVVQQSKQRSYTCMHVQPGQRLLDVGCGPATDTIPLARLVGPAGQVVGVDYDPAMIAEANRRAELAGVSSWVKHKQGDVSSLPFESGEFDASRSERLFQHLPNPAQALAEMARVVKSGGWVVVLDTDWGTLSFDTPEVDIERRLVRVHTERCLHNGYSGRQLYRLFKQQKLVDISVEVCPQIITNYALIRQIALLDEAEEEALTAGIITQDELQRLHASLERADSEGCFFSSGCLILVAGRKT